jgi:hypothetical protein
MVAGQDLYWGTAAEPLAGRHAGLHVSRLRARPDGETPTKLRQQETRARIPSFVVT